MKRDFVKEILDIKSRVEFDSREDYISKLKELDKIFEGNHNNFNQIIKFLPISTVSCFEAFFRSCYKELIDFGSPYNGNAIKFNKIKDIKFDFEIINAFQNQTITIGEFVSHILPCNNFDDIESNLSILLGLDFSREIKIFKKDSISQTVNEEYQLFQKNIDKIIPDIKRMFELRHIFCHEFATKFEIDSEEILRCYKNSLLFLGQTNRFIREILFPNSPETNSEMIAQAISEYEIYQKIFEDLITEINTINSPYLDLNIDLFNKSIENWKIYKESRAKYVADEVAGGSMYPLLYTQNLIHTTKEKIESLNKEFSIFLNHK